MSAQIRKYELNWMYEHPGVGEQHQWGARMSCALNGCDPVHTDDGRVFFEPDRASAASLAAEGVNGHASELVHRIVMFPEWQVATEDPEDS